MSVDDHWSITYNSVKFAILKTDNRKVVIYRH